MRFFRAGVELTNSLKAFADFPAPVTEIQQAALLAQPLAPAAAQPDDVRQLNPATALNALVQLAQNEHRRCF